MGRRGLDGYLEALAAEEARQEEEGAARDGSASGAPARTSSAAAPGLEPSGLTTSVSDHQHQQQQPQPQPQAQQQLETASLPAPASSQSLESGDVDMADSSAGDATPSAREGGAAGISAAASRAPSVGLPHMDWGGVAEDTGGDGGSDGGKGPGSDLQDLQRREAQLAGRRPAEQSQQDEDEEEVPEGAQLPPDVVDSIIQVLQDVLG